MKLRIPSCTLLLALLALGTPAWAGDAKVQVCHIPPGNPSNFHTITISASALSDHLGHGDLPGACFAHCDTLCSDGNACTIDACDASEHCLASHPPVNCDDSNLCTIDSCNPASGCANVPKICSDGNKCTVDACDSVTGSCVAPPVFCPAGQSCNPANGECAGSDPCAGVDCHHGTCVSSGGSARCECNDGWMGNSCDTQSQQQTYNCAQGRNPCTPENIAAGMFYFTHDAANMFVQCDIAGNCYDMTCPPGLVWSQAFLTCM